MLIYSQNAAGIRDIKYGKSNLGKSGCACIAAYNVLEMLGRGMPLADVISCFEGRFSRGGGLMAKGRLGATPADVSAFLRDRGLKPQGGSLRKMQAIKSAGVFVITYWNKPFTKGAHTIAVRFDGNRYTAVNYTSRPCTKDTLEEFLPDKVHYIYGYYIPR